MNDDPLREQGTEKSDYILVHDPTNVVLMHMQCNGIRRALQEKDKYTDELGPELTLYIKTAYQ